MNTKTDKNYWPHAIIASILFIVVSCIVTIKIAIDNPVEMDTSFLTKYQQVDENINSILAEQKQFEKMFDIGLGTSRFIQGKNMLELKIINKNSHDGITNAQIEMLVTRPDSSKFDKKPKAVDVGGGVYRFEDIEIAKPGRWQVVARVRIGDHIGYYKNELLAN